MKEQITVYYNKDKKHPNDYLIKRVFAQEENNYNLTSYYMINNKIREYKSKVKWNTYEINKYILQCMRADFFDRIEYQNVMEGI